MTNPAESKSQLPVETESTDLVETIGSELTGIPKFLQKPLIKAISRLIKGAVNVPGAWLEAIAKDITHNQSVKQLMRESLAKEAIARIPNNPEILERALNHFAADVLGKQQNREEVIRHSIETLAQLPPPDTKLEEPETEIDDDWMNDFARRAENASTERARKLLGRILAGELKRPGSFSLFTLDVLSKLSPKDAELIVAIGPYVIGNSLLLTNKTKAAFDFTSISSLGNLDILTSTSIGIGRAQLTVSTKLTDISDKIFYGFVIGSKNLLIINTNEPKDIKFEVSMVTTVGKEILSLHACEPDPTMLSELAEILKNQGADLYIAETDATDDTSKIGWKNARKIEPQASA